MHCDDRRYNYFSQTHTSQQPISPATLTNIHHPSITFGGLQFPEARELKLPLVPCEKCADSAKKGKAEKAEEKAARQEVIRRGLLHYSPSMPHTLYPYPTTHHSPSISNHLIPTTHHQLSNSKATQPSSHTAAQPHTQNNIAPIQYTQWQI